LPERIIVGTRTRPHLPGRRNRQTQTRWSHRRRLPLDGMRSVCIPRRALGDGPDGRPARDHPKTAGPGASEGCPMTLNKCCPSPSFGHHAGVQRCRPRTLPCRRKLHFSSGRRAASSQPPPAEAYFPGPWTPTVFFVGVPAGSGAERRLDRPMARSCSSSARLGSCGHGRHWSSPAWRRALMSWRW